MRKLLVAAAFAMLCHISVKSQLVTYSFAGTGTCPTQGNSSISFANGSASALARVGALTCQTATNGFNSSGWSQSTAIDNSQYIEVTITANPGYKLDLTSLSFSHLKSSTGASSLQVIHNGTGTFNTASSVYTVSTTETTSVFDFTDFSSSPNATISFRIYGWGASSSTGTTRITGLQINGAVTSSTVFFYDYTNERVGLGTSTLNSKFQVNETSVSTPNNTIFSRTLPTSVPNNNNFNNSSFNSYLNSNFSSTPNVGLTGILNYYQANISGTNNSGYNKVIYNQYKSTAGSGSLSYLTVNDNTFEYGGTVSTGHSNINIVNANTSIYGGSGNITNLTYLRATPGIITGASNYTGTITNQYGLYLGNIAGATNNYAIYSAGGKSYFADSIGIGIISPAQKLDVSGKIRLSGNGSGTELEFYDSNTVANGPAVISKIVGGNIVNHGSGFLGFHTTTNGNITEKMRIDRSGNIGIGTTSPNALLHVYQTANSDLAKFETYYAGGRNILKINAGGSITHTYDSSLRYMLTSNGTIDKGLPAGYDNGLLALSPTSYISGGGSGIGKLEFFTNNSSRFKITENGQIGIGTTNPTSRLHVNGSIRFESFKNTIAKDSILTTDSIGNLQFVKMPTAQQTDSSKWAYVGSNIYNKNGGNVGIGTINPTSKLQVNGSVRFDVYRNNAVSDSVLTTDSLGNLRLTRIATNNVNDSSKWAYSGNNIYNKNSGFVGIGVTNPTAKLHTLGSVRLESYTNNNAEDSVLITDINGNLKLKSLSTFSNINLNATFTAANGLIKSGNTVSLGDSLRNYTQINLNGYNLAFNGNGNLGIGTETPTAQLHLTKGLRLEKFRNNYSLDSVLTTNDSGNVVFRYIPSVTSSNGGTYKFINGLTNYNDSVFLGGNLNDNISFNLDSLYDFSISSGRNKILSANHNGNIGIGTIASNFKVDILGNLNLGFENSSSSGYSSKLYFGANGATDALWLAKFADANSEATLRTNLGSATSNNKFSIGNASGNNWKPAFEVNANGNVTVGTSQSTSLFSVDSAHSVKLSVGNLNWAKTAILTTTNVDGIDYTDITVPSVLNNNTRLRLSSTGGVGIGVDAIDTAYSLMVKGKIKSKGLKVQTSGWADYVFNNNYKLNSLEYLESYVNKYKHLPEIPTANVVIKDGVDVGDMQVKLLKKVEELTLYIIEQNKRINELEKNNKALKQQNTNVETLNQQMAELKALILNKNK